MLCISTELKPDLDNLPFIDSLLSDVENSLDGKVTSYTKDLIEQISNLHKTLPSGDRDIKLADRICDLGRSIRWISTEKATLCFYVALKLQLSTSEDQPTLSIAATLGRLSFEFLEQKNYEKAKRYIDLYLAMVREATSDESEIIFALNEASEVYFEMNLKSEAFAFQAEALELARKTKGEFSHTYTEQLGNLACCCACAEDYKSASDYLLKAISIEKHLLDQPYDKDFAEFILKEEKDFQMARGEVEIPADLAATSHEFRNYLAERLLVVTDLLYAKGCLELKMGDVDKALETFRSVLDYLDLPGLDYFIKHDKKDAKEKLEEALQLSKSKAAS
jgi:tetratricopeptide (TPR) repeat protein